MKSTSTTWKRFGIVAEYRKLLPPFQNANQVEAWRALQYCDVERCSALAEGSSDSFLTAIKHLSQIESADNLESVMADAAHAIAEAAAQQAPSHRHESAATAAYEAKLAQIDALNKQIFSVSPSPDLKTL